MNLLPDWLPRSNTVNLLAGAFLLSSLLVVSRRRQLECVGALRANAVALGLIAITVALATRTWHIALAGVLALAVKAGVIPSLLATRARRASASSVDVRALVSLPAGALICGALVVLAFSQTRALFGTHGDILAACLPVSVAVTLIGLFVMVTRRQALMQVVGLVLLENAIFLAAVSLTYGMPLVVEIGVLLDLMAGVAVLGLFVQRLDETLGDGDTSSLTRLKG
jgi:hydrogenase-4 component E